MPKTRTFSDTPQTIGNADPTEDGSPVQREFETPSGETYEDTEPRNEADVPVTFLSDAPAAPAQNWEQLQTSSPQSYVDPFAVAGGNTELADDFEITFDLTQVGPTPPPIGTYHGRILGIKPGNPSAKGYACWIWRLQVMEGEHAGKEAQHYTYDGPGAFKILEITQSIGLPDGATITPGLIRNRAIVFTMERNVFQGVEKAPRVGTVMPPIHHPIGAVLSEDPTTLDEPPPF